MMSKNIRYLALASLVVLAACSTAPALIQGKPTEPASQGGSVALQNPSLGAKTQALEERSVVAYPTSSGRRPYQSSSDNASLTSYKQALAASIERAGKQYLHPSRPEEPLRAVIVCELVVSRDGKASIKVLRAPNDDEMQRRAKAILQSAEPFPPPPSGKAITFTETLLFDWQGRFRVRTRLAG